MKVKSRKSWYTKVPKRHSILVRKDFKKDYKDSLIILHYNFLNIEVVSTNSVCDEIRLDRLMVNSIYNCGLIIVN